MQIRLDYISGLLGRRMGRICLTRKRSNSGFIAVTLRDQTRLQKASRFQRNVQERMACQGLSMLLLFFSAGTPLRVSTSEVRRLLRGILCRLRHPISGCNPRQTSILASMFWKLTISSKLWNHFICMAGKKAPLEYAKVSISPQSGRNA